MMKHLQISVTPIQPKPVCRRLTPRRLRWSTPTAQARLHCPLYIVWLLRLVSPHPQLIGCVVSSRAVTASDATQIVNLVSTHTRVSRLEFYVALALVAIAQSGQGEHQTSVHCESTAYRFYQTSASSGSPLLLRRMPCLSPSSTSPASLHPPSITFKAHSLPPRPTLHQMILGQPLPISKTLPQVYLLRRLELLAPGCPKTGTDDKKGSALRCTALKASSSIDTRSTS